jgi:hypothetical protein
MSAIDIIITVEIVIGFILAISFVITYAFSPWYSTIPGRALMNLGVGIAIVLGLSVGRIFWHSRPFWLDVVRVSALGYVVVALAVQLGVLLYVRAQHKREESNR